MRANNVHLSEFVVPESKDTEILLVAEMMTIPTCILDVRKIVTEEMLGNDNVRDMFRKLLQKHDSRQQIDMTTMWAVCDKTFFREYVIPYTSRATTELGAIEHAKIIKELYLRRMAYFSALKTLQMIKDGAESSALMSNNHKLSEDMANAMKVDGLKTMTEAINDLAEDMQNGNSAKIPTGIRWLDYYTYGGFGAGDLVIIAARPSVGKTALALQIANFQAQQNFYTAFFSLEMTNKTLAKRTLLATGMVKPIDFYRDTDWNSLENAIKRSTSDYFLMDDESTTIDEIEAKIESLCREKRCRIAYIDYLGLIRIIHSTGSLIRDLGEITGRLKRLAKRCGIPIVVLSQLNRSSASEGRSPQLYDLRDSGSIEQDADVVLMLARPMDFDSENEDLPRIEMFLRKNRESKNNISVELTGSKTYTNFQEQ